MTDETGIIQHAKFDTPNRKEGYTTDDNARALIVCARLNKIEPSSQSAKLANIYLSFLYHMQKSDGKMRNFLSYSRSYLDQTGSDDCLGRTLWACGTVINSNLEKAKKQLSQEIFNEALPHALTSTSPRTKAFAILGLNHYQQAFPQDKILFEKIGILANQLLKLFKKTSSVNWFWFEEILTYCNGRLPQALFTAYFHTKNLKCLQVANSSFDFISKIQTPNDIFVPIGNDGWFKKGGKITKFDQQSIEAATMAETAIEAFRITKKIKFRNLAKQFFFWFYGKNTLGIEIYNSKTGSCYDGITPNGVNLNQGAEATIGYLLARLNFEQI